MSLLVKHVCKVFVTVCETSCQWKVHIRKEMFYNRVTTSFIYNGFGKKSIDFRAAFLKLHLWILINTSRLGKVNSSIPKFLQVKSQYCIRNWHKKQGKHKNEFAKLHTLRVFTPYVPSRRHLFVPYTLSCFTCLT